MAPPWLCPADPSGRSSNVNAAAFVRGYLHDLERSKRASDGRNAHGYI
jgi:hypothetical protein